MQNDRQPGLLVEEMNKPAEEEESLAAQGKRSESLEAELAAYCKALGHPLRVEILGLLRTLERCVCGDLVARLPVAQSTVSQHLKVLKRAGLIKGNYAGPCTYYCVDTRNLNRFKALISAL